MNAHEDPVSPHRPEPGDPRVRRSLSRDERGAVTAEFAIGLSVVLLVLGLVVGGLLLAAHRVVLTSAAADVARLEARGDAEAAGVRLAVVGSGTSAKRWQQGVLHCVRLSASPGKGALSVLGVSATACAASSDGGGS